MKRKEIEKGKMDGGVGDLRFQIPKYFKELWFKK